MQVEQSYRVQVLRGGGGGGGEDELFGNRLCVFDRETVLCWSSYRGFEVT